LNDLDDLDRAAFEALRALYAEREAAGAHRASIDVLLLTAPRHVALAIEDLAVPHWFNEESVDAVIEFPEEPAAQLLSRLTELPFIRQHPRGFTYHDETRQILRDNLLRKDRERFSRVCARLTNLLAAVGEREVSEEIGAELVYLRLGADEASGLAMFEGAFNEAHRQRRLTSCGTLVGLALEIKPLLSTATAQLIEYYQGLLALLQDRWGDAGSALLPLARQALAPPLRGRVVVGLGQVFERTGRFESAIRLYRDELGTTNGNSASVGQQAEIHQRAAEAYMAIGDLAKCEEHVKRSTALNEKIGDTLARASNLETLGVLYGKLREVRRADSAFAAALRLFEESGQRFETARLYNLWGDLSVALNRWEEAARLYTLAQQVKIEAGDNYGLAFVYRNIASVRLQRGDRMGARQHLEASLSLLLQFKDNVNAAVVLRGLSQITEPPENVELLARAVDVLPQGSPLRVSYAEELSRLRHG
jgi:tetratricopeptide (TPR) repeat protein